VDSPDGTLAPPVKVQPALGPAQPALGPAQVAATGSAPPAASIQDKGGQLANVLAYGAKGDAQRVGDGAIKSGQVTLTSASGRFAASDVGKTISVYGAGASGVPLNTTIAGFTNSTTITLTASASTTVSGEDVAWGTDDTAAIQAAINSGTPAALPAAKAFLVTASLNVGNGSQSAVSTLQGLGIVGLGSSRDPGVGFGGGYPTIYWAGPQSKTATVINVLGPIVHVKLFDFAINCRNLAGTGVTMTHIEESQVVGISVINMNANFAFILTAFANPTGTANGANNNWFENLDAGGSTIISGGGGMLIGAGTYGPAPHLDAAQNLFLNCRFRFDSLPTGTVGIQLQFTDSSTFINTLTYAATGVNMVSPSGGTTFPGGYHFISCPLQSSVANQNVVSSGYTGAPVPQATFIGYPRGDGQALPGGTQVGWDNQGNAFGSWTFLSPVTVPTLTVNGPISTNVTAITASSYTVLPMDSFITSAPTGAQAISFPNANTCRGREITVNVTTAQTTTITPAAGAIDGAPTATVVGANHSKVFISDGTAWHTKAQF
jgi:hypothetical protein